MCHNIIQKLGEKNNVNWLHFWPTFSHMSNEQGRDPA